MRTSSRRNRARTPTVDPRQAARRRFRCGSRGGRCGHHQHPQRLRPRRRGERQHRCRCRSRANAGGESPRAVLAYREGRCDSRRGHRRPRQYGLWPEYPAGHARGHRLCADRARRLGARQSAGQRRACDQRARCQRTAHLGAASELAASRAGARADLQGLPRACEWSLARPQHGVQCGVRRCDEHGRGIPEHREHVFAGRRRDDGGDAHTRELPERLRGARAERRCSLYGRLDGLGRGYAGCAVLVFVYEPDDDGADQCQLHRQLDTGVPRHHQLRDAHPSVVECAAPSHRSERQRHRACQQHLCAVRLSRAGERHECSDGAGRPARPDGRRVARRSGPIQFLSRAVVRRRSADPQ